MLCVAKATNTPWGAYTELFRSIFQTGWFVPKILSTPLRATQVAETQVGSWRQKGPGIVCGGLAF